MNKSCRQAVITSICVLVCTPAVPAAVTLGDGSYDILFRVNEAGSDFAGSKTISGSLDVDAADTLDDGARMIGFTATVDSGRSLRLSIEPLGASSFSYPLVGTFELTGLDLLVDGTPARIGDVTFDAASTNIGQYADAAQFIAPTISFSDTSATIAFGFDGSGLAGDQPRISFDIITVPEPQLGGMLLMGVLLRLRCKLRRTIMIDPRNLSAN